MILGLSSGLPTGSLPLGILQGEEAIPGPLRSTAEAVGEGARFYFQQASKYVQLYC